MKVFKKVIIYSALLCVCTVGIGKGLKNIATAGAESGYAVEYAMKKELKEITRPYIGFYECKKLFFGKKNLLKEFKDVTVELTTDGEMVLRYKLKSGKSGESRCGYVYDEKSGEFSITSEKGLMGLSCEVTLNKGKMTVFSKFGNKNLVMQLEQK